MIFRGIAERLEAKKEYFIISIKAKVDNMVSSSFSFLSGIESFLYFLSKLIL